MTIQDLNNLIKDRVGNFAFEMDILLEVDGKLIKKVAIDSNNIIYMIGSKIWEDLATKNNWLTDEINIQAFTTRCCIAYLDLVTNFIQHGIMPYSVFDGPRHPAKDRKKQKVAKQYEEKRGKLKELIQRYKQMFQMDQKAARALVKDIVKLCTGTFKVPNETFQTVGAMLENLGLPKFSFYQDGERLCTYLARTGIVDAVYSNDTDNLAMGCPILLTKVQYPRMKDGKATMMADVVVFRIVAEALALPYESFVDMCIMLGCDYNNRIFRFGPAKVWAFITANYHLEACDRAYWDEENLNVEECRRLFLFYDAEEIEPYAQKAEQYAPETKLLHIEEILSIYNITAPLLVRRFTNAMARYKKEQGVSSEVDEIDILEAMPYDMGDTSSDSTRDLFDFDKLSISIEE